MQVGFFLHLPWGEEEKEEEGEEGERREGEKHWGIESAFDDAVNLFWHRLSSESQADCLKQQQVHTVYSMLVETHLAYLNFC